MQLSTFSDMFKENIDRWKIHPRAAPAVKMERKDIFVAYFLHSSAQCVSIRRLARASHISPPCCEYCDESVGESASPAHPVDIPYLSCSFRPSVSVADNKSSRFELLCRR